MFLPHTISKSTFRFMPDNSYPPTESGALVYPRQLNRWLDVNPQGGALRRAQLYLTFPAFSVTPNWVGVSDIVAAMNFECPKNLSLKTTVNQAAPATRTVVEVTLGTGGVLGTENGEGIST